MISRLITLISLNRKLKTIFLVLAWLMIAPVLLADCYKLIHKPITNHIVPVVDCRGSMSGQPLDGHYFLTSFGTR